MKKSTTIINDKSIMSAQIPMQIMQYIAPNTSIGVEVYSDGIALWLSQKKMAELFGVEVNTINYHLKEIFASGELEETSVIRKIRITANDGKPYLTGLYHLDAIIAVGYRVNSYLATKFRIWATSVLREYIVKGFALDDERLKGNDSYADYFDELLARIRDIRTSEKRAYLRIREIFALAADYNPQSEAAQLFFATMQNKMLFAATGKTAAELILQRADANQPNMGATSWKGSIVRKGDVGTAKNYLYAEEIDILNRIVNIFLEQAELKVLRKQELLTADWLEYLNKFLKENDLPSLDSAGSISHQKALSHAETQYLLFEAKRKENIEQDAENKYLEDLQASVKLVAARRKKTSRK
ncbi:MAG: virulence RhuM family protein [Candidatus Cloacimonas sp.]|jgi:hypothetical protein|nr:virulence RhuM family protein [Candidatus Cloacimonas sp.]